MEKELSTEVEECNLEEIFQGKYRFIRHIGSGSFAEVILIQNLRTNTFHACKVCSRKQLMLHKMFGRFEQEVRILQTLEHPNIVKIEDLIFTDKFILIIMEYCSNGELFSYISASGYLPEREVQKFLRQLLQALSYIHKRKIAHRDIKPENILLDNNLNIKLADFGICHQIEPDNLMTTPCGSLFYVSPEIVANKPYDGEKSDIWSLGIVTYSMATGRLPWTEVNQAQLFKEIMSREIRFPKNITQELKDIVLAMLEREVSKRPTADQLLSFPFVKTNDLLTPSGMKIGASSSTSLFKTINSPPSRTKLRPIIRPTKSTANSADSVKCFLQASKRRYVMSTSPVPRPLV